MNPILTKPAHELAALLADGDLTVDDYYERLSLLQSR